MKFKVFQLGRSGTGVPPVGFKPALSRTNAVEKRRAKEGTDNAPFGDRIRTSNALRRSAFSASLRLFRPRSTTWFRLRPTRAGRPCHYAAFSLLEVMIAITIFFMCSFAILQLVSNSLVNVRRMQRPLVDASPVLARFAATNMLEEDTYQGRLSDADLLGKGYENYNWKAEVVEVASNHLYRVDCVVQLQGSREVVSQLSTLLYKPQSKPGSLDGGIGNQRR